MEMIGFTDENILQYVKTIFEQIKGQITRSSDRS